MSRPTPHYHSVLAKPSPLSSSPSSGPAPASCPSAPARGSRQQKRPAMMGKREGRRGLDSRHDLQWRGQVRRKAAMNLYSLCCCCYFPLSNLRHPSGQCPTQADPKSLAFNDSTLRATTTFPFPHPQTAPPTALTSPCPISPPGCLTSNASILRCASTLPAQRLRTVIRAHYRATGLLSSNWACGIKGRCGVKGTCGI